MEVSEGRQNCYNAILAFLLFIYRAPQGRSYFSQDLGPLKATAEGILSDVFRNRMAHSASRDSQTMQPFAVETYLQQFMPLES